jgi:nucleotide-binding universal stress UspA family protein
MLIKKVLALTDGSDISRNALRYAVEICNQFGSQLYLLTVVDQVPSSLDAEISKDTFEKLESQLRQEMDKCSEYCETTGLACRSEVRQGIAHEEIVAFATEKDIDLIVSATHGRSGWPHMLLGSVAEKIVRHAPCPVLTVRPKSKNWEMQTPEACKLDDHTPAKSLK